MHLTGATTPGQEFQGAGGSRDKIVKSEQGSIVERETIVSILTRAVVGTITQTKPTKPTKPMKTGMFQALTCRK